MNRPLLGASASEIGIDRKDREPIQSQIARQLRALVHSGRLKPQIKLPSTRALSEELSVARATVVEAYEQLLSEGYLETRSGSGTRVAAELPESLLTPSPAKSTKASGPRLTVKREPARPFRSGLVDWENFPHDDWGRLLGRFWRNPPVTLLEHHDSFGWMPLRQAIARHLFEWRGITCSEEQVIVTAGGLDAFDLIGRAIFAPGDKVWFEEPGYPTARRIFSLGGVTVAPVPVDDEGLVVARGLERAADGRAAFVTPARQYPTGVTMPLARRLELLDWAAEAQAIVIEDDYDSEYRFQGQPIPALQGISASNRVVYVGTFAKILFPAMRLGFLVVPEAFREGLISALSVTGQFPPLLTQAALADFINEGHFARHLRRMRRLYATRRQYFMEICEEYLSPWLRLRRTESGIQLVGLFHENHDDKAVAAAARAHGVNVSPLSIQYRHGLVQRGLLMGFAAADEKTTKKAMGKLRDVLRMTMG